MVREYDTQLLESVAVRRRRLRDALLYGSLRHRRTLDENLVKAFIGLLIAAVLCAGSVGWSFIQHQRIVQQRQQQQSQSGLPTGGAAATASPTGAADWRGKQVTAAMLQDALRRGGIPDTLYALPDIHKPRPGLESYYFLGSRSGQYAVGVFERGEERIGRSFTSLDQAARWLYDQLVFPDAPPAKLSASKAVAAKNATKQTVRQVRGAVRPARGATASTTVFTLPQGILVDEFGQESGSYLYPDGTSFKERSLPPSTLSTTDRRFPYNYHRYQIAKEFRVRAGIAAPAFGQPGGGIQFHAEPGLLTEAPDLLTLRWLLRNGYLKRVGSG
ncbi:MAG TPA: TNT domain-containing protein [Streptosporangiaceae bacterium]|jgi:hypothetical protein